LADAAISAAKAQAHTEVEPRHVFFAAVSEFKDDPRAEGLVAVARQRLEPRGNALQPPVLTPAAEELLAQMTSVDEALRLAAEALTSGGASASEPTTAQMQTHTEAAAANGPQPAAAPRVERESVDEVLAELDALVGLDAVKARVRSVIAVVRANAERERAGLPTVNPSLHLVFTGPPGTGKTTVARLVARLYAATGVIPDSRFTEASRADLIAGYVGQTAIKTADVIARARPGVLFIDEAYALTPTSDVDFGTEAIATLVKAMEDHRDELAVIVAGYEDEMAQFIQSNPGLRSRFKTYVSFGNYAPDELTVIFRSFAAEAGIELAEGVEERVTTAMREAAALPGFGNARFARSLFEQAYVRMAERAAADGVVEVDELHALLPEDIAVDVEALHRKTRRIGFGPEE